MWKFLISLGQFVVSATRRLLGKSAQRKLAQMVIEDMLVETDLLAEQLAERQIRLDEWELSMRNHLKDMYLQEYMLARGGRQNMNNRDYGSLGGMLAEQYRYLSRFSAEIASGQLSQGQIAARSRMYFRSAREAFERAQWRIAREAGLRYVKWTMNPELENCPDCIDFASMGWRRAETDPYGGAFPGSGDTVCLTNCGCFLEYRKRP